MPYLAAVMAACSPMDMPVRGSPLRGRCGTTWPGRSLVSRLTLRVRLNSSRSLRKFSFTPIGASLVVSTPPAMPTSIWPSAILFATAIIGLQAGAARLLEVVGGGRRD